MDLVERAIVFATIAHEGQKRKGSNIPYISHPYKVGMYLMQQGCSDEVVAAGILHDTVEDTDTTIEEIKELFGQNVAEYVDGVSEPDKWLSWEERKAHTIHFLKGALLEIRLVSCADKFDNVKCLIQDYKEIGEELWKRFNRGKEQQIWYHKELVEVLCNRNDIPKNITLFEQYRQSVDEFIKVVNSHE